jgi:hypothetical protein
MKKANPLSDSNDEEEEESILLVDGEGQIDPILAKVVLYALVWEKFHDGTLIKEIQKVYDPEFEEIPTLKKLKECHADVFLLEFVAQLRCSEILEWGAWEEGLGKIKLSKLPDIKKQWIEGKRSIE